MYYKKAALKFSCAGCGACCHGRKDAYILRKENEAKKIRAFLKLSSAWFRRRYLVRLDNMQSQNTLGIRIDNNGKCVFLDDKKKCRICSVRPVQCKTYPFWPELVQTRNAWMTESERCEGIGRGQRVEVQVIERRITQCLSYFHDSS